MAKMIAIILGIILLIWICFGVGCLIINKVLSKARLKVGDTVQIFVGGKFNRSATITGVTPESIVIYDGLHLPLDYRGSFYGRGTDIDGVEFWYLKHRKHYYLVPYAERLAERFNLLDDPYNLEAESAPLAASQEQDKDVSEDEASESGQDDEEDGL